MEPENINQTPQTDPNFPQNPPVQTNNTNKKSLLLLSIIGVIILLIIAAGGIAYFYGTNNTNNSTDQLPPITSITPVITQTPPTVIPSESPKPDDLGLISWSFTDAENEIYIKHTMSMFKVKDDSSSKDESKSIVLSQDDFATDGPKKVESLDINKYNWTDMLTEHYNESTGIPGLLVPDRLLSFQRVPNTNNFLFVIESTSKTGVSSLNPNDYFRNTRNLYLYKRDQLEAGLKKIATFSNGQTEYTFPKISTFSTDGRYVIVNLYQCVECDPHVPELFVVDLQTLMSRNVGRTSTFYWKLNGNYEYKEYVVIECKEPQPFECTQDPDTLPLKTGSI